MNIDIHYRFLTGFVIGFEFGNPDDDFKFAMSIGFIELAFGVEDGTKH